MEALELKPQSSAIPFGTLTQQQVNNEIIETFQVSANWGTTVMIGTAGLLFLAGFLAFLLWRAAD